MSRLVSNSNYAQLSQFPSNAINSAPILQVGFVHRKCHNCTGFHAEISPISRPIRKVNTQKFKCGILTGACWSDPCNYRWAFRVSAFLSCIKKCVFKTPDVKLFTSRVFSFRLGAMDARAPLTWTRIIIVGFIFRARLFCGLFCPLVSSAGRRWWWLSRLKAPSFLYNIRSEWNVRKKPWKKSRHAREGLLC